MLAHLGPGKANRWVGDQGAALWNHNGEHLRTLATSRQLRVLNSFGDKRSAAWTWMKPGSGTRIDYILVRGGRAQYANAIGPAPKWQEPTEATVDHRPIQAKWHLPCIRR